MRKIDSSLPDEVTKNYLFASTAVICSDDLNENSGSENDDDKNTSNNKKNGLKNGSSNIIPATKDTFNGPGMITFDGDQTLYTDGANFDSNPRLARYLLELLRNGVFVGVVTAAGYEYNVEKYEFRLSGLLNYFKAQGLTPEECERFVLFGGECNYLVHVSIIILQDRSTGASNVFSNFIKTHVLTFCFFLRQSWAAIIISTQ
jgi:IMP-specific 5'-nucleotidase